MSWGSPTATDAVIILSVVLLAWYVIGSQVNRRRANRWVRWIGEGLKVHGVKASIKWLGSSRFQITTEQGPTPYARLGIAVLLEPREMLLLWAVNRLRGRRDLVVVKGELTVAPHRELEVFDQASQPGKEAMRAVRKEGWHLTLPRLRSTYGWATPLHQTASLPSWWARFLEAARIPLLRGSVRKDPPHVLLVLLPIVDRLSGEKFLAEVRAIGEEATGIRQ